MEDLYEGNNSGNDKKLAGAQEGRASLSFWIVVSYAEVVLLQGCAIVPGAGMSEMAAVMAGGLPGLRWNRGEVYMQQEQSPGWGESQSYLSLDGG